MRRNSPSLSQTRATRVGNARVSSWRSQTINHSSSTQSSKRVAPARRAGTPREPPPRRRSRDGKHRAARRILQERREVRRARHPACLQRLQHVVVRVAGTGTTRKRAEHLVRDAIGLHRGARARAETRGGVRGARHRASAKRPHDGTEARARRRTTKCGVANRAKVAGSRISVRSLVCLPSVILTFR